MAEKIPLNFYKRITKPLKRVPESVYKAPLNKASTIISTLGTNTTDKDRFITLSLSSADTDQSFVAFSNIPLEPRDYINVIPSKIVLGENDEIVASADIEDLATINDPGLFWLYDIPTQITDTNLQVGFTTGTSVTADFGAGGLSIITRTINTDFNDWSGWTTQSFRVSSGLLGTGPTGWRSGLNINGVPASGTFQIYKQTSTTEEQQYFNNNYYTRLQLNNVSYTGDFINDATKSARGLIVAPGSTEVTLNPLLNPVGTNIKDGLFGKTIKVVSWLRASSATKVVFDAPIWYDSTHQSGSVRPTYGVKNNFTVFNVTTGWQKFETSFYVPTSAEWRNNSYDINLLNTSDPNWGTPAYVYPIIDPSVVIPLSAFSNVQVRFNVFRGPDTLLRDGYNANTWRVAASANAFLLTNGYYDIGGLEVFIGDKTSTVLLTSFTPVNYTYDLTNETDTNITLSILESVNTQ